jgi:hypothetical protein
MYCFQHCFICRPSDSTVSEDAGIEPKTVSLLAVLLLCGVTSGAYPEPRAGAAGSGPHSQDWPEESNSPSQVRGASS